MSQPSGEHARRFFTLADALILTAASAVALSCLRLPLERRMGFIADGRIIDNVRPATLIAAAFALCWGCAVLAIEIRSGHSLFVDRVKRPGFLACFMATAGSLVKLFFLLIWGATRNYQTESWYVPTLVGQLIEPAAVGVFATWGTMLLCKTWRLGRTWSDYLGIIVGLTWLTLYGVSWVALCFN